MPNGQLRTQVFRRSAYNAVARGESTHFPSTHAWFGCGLGRWGAVRGWACGRGVRGGAGWRCGGVGVAWWRCGLGCVVSALASLRCQRKREREHFGRFIIGLLLSCFCIKLCALVVFSHVDEWILRVSQTWMGPWMDQQVEGYVGTVPAHVASLVSTFERGRRR